MNLRVTQSSPFPLGDYVIRYTVTVVPSGKSFKIVKNVVIAGTSGSSNTLAASPETAGGKRPLLAANQNNTSNNNTSLQSTQVPCPYGLPRQINGVCPIIPEAP
jgi:hypothetical protein